MVRWTYGPRLWAVPVMFSAIQALHNAHSVFLDATKSPSGAAPCKIQSFRLQLLNMEMCTYTQFKLSFYSTRDPQHEHMAYAIRLFIPSGSEAIWH